MTLEATICFFAGIGLFYFSILIADCARRSWHRLGLYRLKYCLRPSSIANRRFGPQEEFLSYAIFERCSRILGVTHTMPRGALIRANPQLFK